MAEQSHLEKLLFARDGRRREPIDAIINEVLSTNNSADVSSRCGAVSLRFTHNFRGALRGEYALPWLLPTWILVEEQFYLVVTFAAISVAFERWLRSKILNTIITANTSAMPLIESNLCSW
jgi:peptidoglycan/LPS O-acetylase OafA/YrhL